MAELRETQGEAHTMSGMEGGREMAWMYKVFSITWPAASQQFLILLPNLALMPIVQKVYQFRSLCN